MGKIVKYCGKCEEGFAAKFGFCPNCGEHLEAFEMNPLNEPGQPEILTAANPEPEAPLQNSFETFPKVEAPVVPAAAAFADNDILELDSVDVAEETAPETETFIRQVEPVAASETVNQYQFIPKTEETQSYPHYEASEEDSAFHVTVIEAKDVQLRNGLLLGFGSLFLAATVIAWVWALFVANLPVGALDEQELYAFVGPIEETPMEIDKPPKKDKDEGGGGGGQDSTPATKGRLPTQTANPQNPLLMVTQMTNPTFVVRNETKGNIKREQTNENIGLTNGLVSDNLAGGTGTGGGIGTGNGRGAGSGIGSGEGSGSGGGSGGGTGGGTGGLDNDDEPQITKAVGVTVGMKILSRPQPRYTDAARVNNVQGTVTLRVTFTAAGTIGSVSPVSGLPYGLTEQAIAAAKQIRFEPPKRNGQPYAVTKTVSYTFTIY